MTEWSEAVSQGEYPAGVFYLPAHVVEHYDEPSTDPASPSYRGNDGYTLAALRESVRLHGVREPLLVGKSRFEVEHHGDQTPLAFDGNHRLAVAKEAALSFVPCLDAGAHLDNDDVLSLTVDEIRGLGGWVA